MDLSSKQASINSTARFGFAFLFAGYCLLAIFTSIPLQKTFHGTGLSQSAQLALHQGGSTSQIGEKPSFKGRFPEAVAVAPLDKKLVARPSEPQSAA